MPRLTYMPFPFQIIQRPNEVTILYEYVHAVRYIFANGSPHPPGHIDWWLGDSRGRWEGDTLVVDVTHFNDQTWFDRAGNFHSDALHLTERYTLIDVDHISYVVTVEEYHAYRVIPLDGRPHVGPNVKLWMGDGRGHWEGNTLVIDTTNVRGARLSYTGDFHSDNAHIVERLTFVDASTINYEATVDDPIVFTRPWTMRIAHRRRPDDEIWESACYEGNKDADGWLLTPDTEQE